MDTVKQTAASDTPKTARIGRFAGVLEKELDEATYHHHRGGDLYFCNAYPGVIYE